MSNTANIAGRRGSLLVLKWLLKNHVEFGDDILHSAMLGVCKRGDCAVSRWIVEAHENAIKEHLLEYLERAETSDIVQRLLNYESQLSKFELGELLNKHCSMGHCLIVKVFIDNCDRYSSSDIQNALEVASRYGQLDVFTIIGDTFSVPHEERTKIMNADQTYRGGIKTPMSLNPYTPINYANIPSVNISTPTVYALKHPQTTKTRAWKKSISETADKEYKKALQLNKLCGAVESLNSDKNCQECRCILNSEPKIPDFLLLECAMLACKQHNYKTLQILFEYNDETLAFKLLVKARQNHLDVETIHHIHLIMRNIVKCSLFLLITHVKDGKDLKALIDSFDEDFQFDLKDYLEALNHLVINRIQNPELLLDASVKLAECDDVLVPACRLDYPEIVRFIMETGHYTASTLNGAIQVTIKHDNAHVLEIFIANKSVDDIKSLYTSCCEHSAKACIDMLLKKENNLSYLHFEQNDNVGSTLDAAIQTTLEDDNSVVFELLLENKSDEDTKDIFLRCCEQSAKACIEILLKIEFRAYLQNNIGDILKCLCAKNSAKIIETIITTCTCIKLDKKDSQFILSEACSKNWQCIIEKIKGKHKFSGGDIVAAIKCAFKNKHGHLIHCLISGIRFTTKQRSAMIKYAVKFGFYEYAAIIIQQKADLDWDELRDLSIPTELTESFTNFMHQVIVSRGIGKKYSSNEKEKYKYIKRVIDKFHITGGSTQTVDMFLDICKSGHGTAECSYCLRHLLENYTQLFDDEVINAGLNHAVEKHVAWTFTVLAEFYVKKYNTEDIKLYAMEMFVNTCNARYIDTGCEDEKCLELIMKLFNLPDDTVMAGVNNYIKKRYDDSEPLTCMWRPTPHILLLILLGEPRFIVRLICSKWEIDDQTIEDIVSKRCNESDVWKILLDKFPTEITDETKFKILLCCIKSHYQSIKIFRTVLSTDKQRTNEEVCTLLSACKEYMHRVDCVTPLLQKYQNLPLQDVLCVMNHLLTDKDQPFVVYEIIEVCSEYHDVYRAMIDEMQSKPGFDKDRLFWNPSKSVLVKVVKKYTKKLQNMKK